MLPIVFGLFKKAAGGGGGAATQGPQAGSTAISDFDTPWPARSWDNPEYVFNTSAFASGPLNVFINKMEYLKATNFGFSIPSGATINGIVVTIERRCSDFEIKDYAARIVKGGVIKNTDKSNPNLYSSTSFESTTYGGPTDLWGETWTASDINNSGFGFAISPYLLSSVKFFNTAELRNLRIKVHYTT